jgi:hypothetical protein
VAVRLVAPVGDAEVDLAWLVMTMAFGLAALAAILRKSPPPPDKTDERLTAIEQRLDERDEADAVRAARIDRDMAEMRETLARMTARPWPRR